MTKASVEPPKAKSSSCRNDGGHGRRGRRSRSQRRRHKRMLLITAACVVVGGVLLAGVGFVLVRKIVRNPQRYERLGYALLDEGRLDDAVQQFQRGLAYAKDERRRVAMLTAIADRVENTTTSVDEASERWFAAADLRVTAARQTPEAATKLPVEQWYRYARLSHHPKMWQLCFRGIRARVHQGVAQPADAFRDAVCRIELSLLGTGKPPNGWQAARDALGDPRGTRRDAVLAMRALCDAALAQEVKVSNPQQGRMLRDQAITAAHDLLRASEDDNNKLLPQTVALRTLQKLNGKQTWQLLNSDPGVDAVFKRFDQQPPPKQSHRLAEEAAIIRYLTRFFTPPPAADRDEDAEKRVEKLHQRALSLTETAPDSIVARMALAESATARGRNEEAEKQNTWLLDRDTVEAKVDSVFLAQARTQALSELVFAAADQLERGEPKNRDRDLALLQARVEEAKVNLDEEAPARRLFGHWLLFYEGRPLQCLGRILQDQMSLSPRLMIRNQLVLARALAAIGEWGGAAELLHRIHRAHGVGLSAKAYWNSEQLRAEALLRVKRPAGALEVLNRRSSQFPDEAPSDEHWFLATQARVCAADSIEKLNREANIIEEKIARLPDKYRTKSILLLVEARDRAGNRKQGHEVLKQYWTETPGAGRIGAELLRRLAQDEKQEQVQTLAEKLLAELPDGAIKSELSKTQGENSWNPARVTLLAAAFDKPVKRTAAWLQYLIENKRRRDFETELTAAMNSTANSEAAALLLLDALSQSKQEKALAMLADQLERIEEWQWLASLVKARGELLAEQPRKAFELVDALNSEWGFLSAVTKTRGAAAMALNRYEDARDNLRMVTHSNPDDVAAHLALARCEHQLGRHADALDSLGEAWRWSMNADVRERFLNYAAQHGDSRRVISVRRQIANLAPENHQNKIKLADLLHSNGREKEAKRLVDTLREEGVESLRLTRLQARMRLDAGDRKQAVELLRDACQKHLAEDAPDIGSLFSALSLLRQMGETEFSKKLIDSRLETLSGTARIPWIRAQALYLYQEEDYAGALKFLQAEEGENDSPALMALQVRCLTKLQQLGQAEQKLAAIPSKAEDPEIDLAEAELAAAKGQWNRARRISGILLNRNPDRLEARIIRIQAALAGDLEDADEILSQDMEAIARMRPDHPVLYRVMTIQALEKGDIQTASKTVGKLVEQDAADPRLLAAVGDALHRQGQFKELENALPDWLGRFPDSPELLVLRAAVHAHSGDAKAQISTLKQAYEQTPHTPAIARQYALALLDNSQWERARDLLENPPFTIKDNAPLLMLRSQSRARTGNPEKAVGDAVAALQCRADNPDALTAIANEIIDFLDEDALQKELAKQKEVNDPRKALAFTLHHLQLKIADSTAIAEAQSFADGLPKEHPLRAAAQGMLADGWLRINQPEKALPIYTVLIENGTTSAHLLNNAAYAAAHAQSEADLPKAIKWAQEAVDAAANDPIRRANYLDTLGQAQWVNGFTRDAKQSFTRSIRTRNNAKVRLKLVRLLAEEGQFEEAKPHLAQVEQTARDKNNSELLLDAAALRKAHLPLSQ